MRFEKVSYEAFMKDLTRHGFGWMPEDEKKKAWEGIKLPERKTKFSAGYDIVTPIDFFIRPHGKVTIPTGIKVYFAPEEARSFHLELYIRSSVGITRGVVMSNQTGVIDADYYGNEDNEGCMLIALTNTNSHQVKFRAGERIIQGIFAIHGLTSDDNASGLRTGGVGSTNGSD